MVSLSGSARPIRLGFLLSWLALPVVCFGQNVGEDAQERAREARFRSLWDEARLLHEQENYSQALDSYRQILTEFPKSQRTALRVAICLEKLGRSDEALQAYDRAIGMNPQDYWAEAGLFYKARACLAAGEKEEASAVAQRLKREYPDSSYAVRALAIEAEAAGKPVEQAQALVARELQAAEMLEQARALSQQKNDPLASDKLNEIIRLYPESASALRAHEMMGHLHIRGERFNDALRSFSLILNRVGQSAPTSRIVRTAKTRVAALYHKTGRRAQAIAMYDDLLQSAGDSPELSNAALQKAGIEFELLQRAQWREEPISKEQWDRVRQLCLSVLRMQKATAEEKARAELMVVESYAWQGKREEELRAGLEFLQRHDPVKTKREVATVHMLVGEALLKLKRRAEAVEHFRQVLALYEGKTDADFWGADHLAKVHFYLWQNLPIIGGSREERERIGRNLLDRFPNSQYEDIVRPELEGANEDR